MKECGKVIIRANTHVDSFTNFYFGYKSEIAFYF